MKNLSLSARMTIAVTAAMAIMLGLLIFLEVRQVTRAANRQGLVNAEELANRYANQIGRDLNEALLTARTVAHTFEGMKAAWVDDRSLYNAILKQVLVANPKFAAVWSCWEPDALDGNDADFVGKSGHDATGRFIPLWYRTSEDAQLEKLSDYTVPGQGDYYLGVKASDRELATEPRQFRAGAFASESVGMAVPIRYNGEVVGAAGVLIPTAALQQAVGQIRPYQTGFARLTAPSGVCVAHPDQQSIGQNLLAGAEHEPLRRALA
ncbi:MAG TPA: hypothetical protein VGD81_08475, partial [Opitutaceae bacterium]